MRDKTFLVLSSALIAGIALRLFNLPYFHHMTADECVYTQAVFAMTKGQLPYKDVFVAHPILYFIIEYPFIWVAPNLLMARTASVLLGFGTLLLVFVIARNLYSNSVAIFALAILGFSPYAIWYNKLAVVENAALFFTTLLLCFFLKYHQSGEKKYLFLCGLFAGIAILSKYSTIFVIIALILYIVFFMKNLRSVVSFMTFAAIIPSIFLLSLLLLNIHTSWYLQTVAFQFIRFSLPISEKIKELGLYFAWILPLLIMATPVMIHRESKQDTLVTLLYTVTFSTMLLANTFFAHYFLMLTPVLCVLAARSLGKSVVKPKGLTKKKVLTIVVFLTHFLIFANFFTYRSAQAEFDIRTKMEVADYIKSITKENDKIWTTEADIAFFAERLVVSPNSSIWKYQGFYEDVWGYVGTTYVGQFAGYPDGLISLSDIQQALDNQKPKVVVVMRFKIADKLIWDGIDNPVHKEKGLAEYVLTHYALDISLYDIDVYARKTTI